MNRVRGNVLVSVLLVVVISLVARSAQADTAIVSISATVPGTPPPNNPIVQLSGIAAPLATITVQRDGTDITAVLAGANADYAILLGSEPVGQHEYIIAAQDDHGQILGSQTLVLNLQLGGTVIISGVFLGPSIAIDKTEVELGQPVTVSGTTAPGSAVTVTVSSNQSYDFSVVAGSDGVWSRSINTETVGTGQQTARARAVSNSTISAYSRPVSFLVNPFDPTTGKAPSDINLDGYSNLIDMSILLYYWHTRNPQNPRTDINKDGYVDIVDFSILLFQWTG